MKATRIKTPANLLEKIETIEKEISDLKLIVVKKLASPGKRVISLRGVLRGVKITAADVSYARRSLYRKFGMI